MIVQKEVDDRFNGAFILIKPKEGLTDEYALKALKKLNEELNGLVEINRTFGDYSLVARIPTEDPEVLERFQDMISHPQYAGNDLIQEVAILPIRTSIHERVPIDRIPETRPVDVIQLYYDLVKDFYKQRGWNIYFDAIPSWDLPSSYPPPMGCGVYRSKTPMEEKTIECEVDWIAGDDADQTSGYAPRGYVEIIPTESPDGKVRRTNEDSLLSAWEDLGIDIRKESVLRPYSF